MKLLRALPLLFLFPMSHLNAGSANDTFLVSLQITAACTLTANDLNFGSNAGAIASNIDMNTTLVVNCTNDAPYSIGLSDGAGASASAATTRKMTNAADSSTVDYNLYTDAPTGNYWGNTCTVVPGVSLNCINATGNGADQTITVYGRVPGGQSTVTVGTYQDTITATINF